MECGARTSPDAIEWAWTMPVIFVTCHLHEACVVVAAHAEVRHDQQQPILSGEIEILDDSGFRYRIVDLVTILSRWCECLTTQAKLMRRE
jgi:hypothetical protein